METSRRMILRGIAAGTLVTVLPDALWSMDAAALDRHQPSELGTGLSAVTPKAVTSSHGDVKRPEALLTGRAATLTARPDRPASVVLDYGRLVGGTAIFRVVAVSGEPLLESSYAQALPWLSPDGDGPAPGKPGTTAAAPKEISFVGIAGAADLSRIQRIPARSGTTRERLVQGGQRFQRIEVTGSGSVSLSLVGFLPTYRLPTSASNQGRFRCSDRRLTDIWSLGAYTLDVAAVPRGALPPLWDIGPDGATVYGDTYTGYQRGVGWTDYTADFDVRIESNEASWLVRGSTPDGIRIVLCADGDALPQSTPGTLRSYVQFTQELISEVALGAPVRAGEWHHVTTMVRGTRAAVRLDGREVTAFTIPAEGGFWGSTAAGWVALANASGAVATFRNLRVEDPAGSVLLATPLTHRAILDEFVAGSNTHAAILDGATRDRLLFTGDLGIASQTLLTTNFDVHYLTDSIDMFSAYQSADGAIATSVPPTANPGRTPGDAFTPGILDYTVHHVTTIHTYWLHTADLRFLRGQWPVVERVLGYLADNVDPDTGLFAPPGPPGSPRVAETLSNAHYYGALQQAAAMARALDDRRRARHLLDRAATLRAAINRRLFNPSTGVYGASTADLDTIIEHANAYAVLYGVAPRNRVATLLAALFTALDRAPGPVQSTAPDQIIGPFTAGYDVLARFAAGDTAPALSIIRRAWGHMLEGSSFYSGGTWEYVDLDGAPGLGTGTSLAHPWSTGPTAALSKYVLGARPIEPGYRRWTVEPQLGDLAWARGAVPTPYGPLFVRWTRTNDGVSIDIDAPPGTTGSVGLPHASEHARVSVDGRDQPAATSPHGAAGHPGYCYIDGVAAGRHRLIAR